MRNKEPKITLKYLQYLVYLSEVKEKEKEKEKEKIFFFNKEKK